VCKIIWRRKNTQYLKRGKQASHTLNRVCRCGGKMRTFASCSKSFMSTLAELKKGQKAVIRSFTNDQLSSKLIEMGCLPGELVFLSKIAPLGSPIAVTVSGYELSLRREEAAAVVIDLVA
jgi:ferrous iron transport protein A